jgi:hypothetical protein
MFRHSSLVAAVISACVLAMPARADGVGVASAVNQNATGQVGGGALRTIRIGKAVFSGERIATDGKGRVQVLLADGSNFMVGPNSSLVIDEFVYRPAEGQAKLVATFGRGVARYVGGKISKNRGGVTIRTRQGTIGVRGGMTNLVDQGGPIVFSFLYGKDLTFVGRNGKTVRVWRSGYSVFANGGSGRSGRTPSDILNAAARAFKGGGGGPRPTDEQLRRFALGNSALPPRPGSPIPPPVITSVGTPVPGTFIDYDFANSTRLMGRPTGTCVTYPSC